MENDKPKQKRVRRADTVTLNATSLSKISGWLEQIGQKLSGVRITRTELANWIIGQQKEELSPRQVSQIKESFFDEIKFAQWALKQVKEAKKRGEKLELKELLKKQKQSRSTKKKKSNEIEPAKRNIGKRSEAMND